MSSLFNPVGPEEPRTYWLRRAAVLGSVAVVLWVGWLLLGAAFGSGGTQSAAPTSGASPSFGLSMSPSIDVTPTDESSASPTASGPSPTVTSPSSSASASQGATRSPSASPSPSATPSCRDADLQVEAATASPSTTEGAGMRVSIKVTNTGPRACSRDVGAKSTDMRLASGSVLVWSWRACSGGSASNVVVLRPKGSWSASTRWPGRVSGSSCASSSAIAQAGSYRAVASAGAVDSGPAVFVVTKP